MTVAYSPALEVSDDPARSPNERAFVPSAGGAVLDIDSIYGASDLGDFYVSGTDQFTDAGTTPATSNGDLIWQWNGQRTTGTNRNIVQATAASRPELAADATYTQSTYWPGGALKWISDEAFSGIIQLWGARIRLHAVSTGTQQDRGFAVLSEDFSPIVDGVGIAEARNIRADGAAGLNGSIIADTNWHTLVTYHDGTDFNIYLDDMTTPDATLTTSLTTLLNLRTGFNTTFTHGGYVHRMAAHSTYNAATPAELASWLEAS